MQALDPWWLGQSVLVTMYMMKLLCCCLLHVCLMRDSLFLCDAMSSCSLYEVSLHVHLQAYLQKLIALEQQAAFQRVAIRCICTLLEAVPHFNFRQSLLAAVIKNIGSPDDVTRLSIYFALHNLYFHLYRIIGLHLSVHHSLVSYITYLTF